jgi:hypothetical protein
MCFIARTGALSRIGPNSTESASFLREGLLTRGAGDSARSRGCKIAVGHLCYENVEKQGQEGS